jgi:hypothetical protein
VTVLAAGVVLAVGLLAVRGVVATNAAAGVDVTVATVVSEVLPPPQADNSNAHSKLKIAPCLRSAGVMRCGIV